MPEKEITNLLKEALQCLQSAEQLLEQAQAEDHDLFVIENRKEDVKHFTMLVEQLQERTTLLALTKECN